MKRTFARTALTVLSIAALFSGLSSAAHAANCSTDTVAGSWGFTLSGTALLPTGAVPVAAVGVVTVDNQGVGSGKESRSVGGDFADETLTAAWTVNSDCTGTLNANIYENGELVRISVTRIAFDSNSKEFRMVQKSLTLPGGMEIPVIITLEGKKQ